MAAVDDRKRGLLLREQVCSLLLKHIVDFDCAEALRERVCDGCKIDTRPVLVEF